MPLYKRLSAATTSRSARSSTGTGTRRPPGPAGRAEHPRSAGRWPALSGGQRAQVGLSLALAKRPRLLLLDEPVAALDPLARREFLASLAGAVAEGGLSVILSSHLLHDLERVCDHLILLAASRTQLCGDIDDVLATHRVLIGPRRRIAGRPGLTVVKATRPPGRPGCWPAWTARSSTRPGRSPRWPGGHRAGLHGTKPPPGQRPLTAIGAAS